ncbi:hypothetical protein CcaverHIS002_0100710 [Cutaneotrichosporon cavernicola]|uniref:mRNA export factor GLE1 n=1 Tax=Cutaneotrichosporon cavernicola TaxID=279322 RepID=A0AA48KYA6_9TREE|nr:uncharacterized protein CcaverHIS019_0100690 [Cutaneotrichosporon cavernicola]BEI79542.1 hypothetical protein CcaverHIS002_0100710 [Cutaneotrichosporon cavernicola]BEI87351.1 hypothetical protein CcaverHIS019_0100690 [Cutaneotrichosporon cavernicola]BEI95120.1 hypothetical protein CcaverHIS631_0100690 [Cutaneotrichosporon cavernicola]BEJ02894.1 hypothetical protein CcaverHIS641_0100690 [Cutaneotrichosporon cavernicola]
MKFGIPDSDSDSDDNFVGVVQDDVSYLSDESDDLPMPDLTRQPLSKLGIAIRNTLVFSDSEDDTNSEDEVGDLLDGMSTTSKTSYRNPKKEKRSAPPPAPRRAPSGARKPNHKVPVAGPSWRPWEPTVADLLRDNGPSEYTKWIRATEADAWKHGHRKAAERQAELDQIRSNIRKEHDRKQKIQGDRDADELLAMMEGLAVRAEAEEKERTRRFQERQAQLWADIDAAIKESERRHGEELAARATAERKRKEDDEARAVAAEKEALARKAEAERVAKEKAEKEAADRAEAEQKQKEAQAAQAAAQRQEDERRAAADTSLHGRREWAKWVDVQKRMKAEVINPLKANKEMRDTLLPTMRLIKRWIGQVVNTQEKILAVTNDLCAKFNEQLSSPPSAANPIKLTEQLHLPYYYLLSHTAKALIRQAVREVEAKPEAAFPLARIIMGVMLRGHPAFGSVVYARLVKKCPFVVPYWPVRVEGQSREEYEQSTGQLVDESHSEYIRRMIGIVRMYLAVLALPLGSLAHTLPAQPTPKQLLELVPEEWRLPAAWTWVATALKANLAKHPAVGPLLLAHLETVGPALVKTYGAQQMNKILVAERAGVESGAIRCDTAATRATIKSFIDTWEQTHQLPAPKGINW